MIKSDFDEFSPRKCKFVILVEVLEHGCSDVVCWVQVQRLLQIVVGHVYHANLHAGAGSIHVILGVVREKVDRPTEFNICALVVLLIETLCTYSVMSQ